MSSGPSGPQDVTDVGVNMNVELKTPDTPARTALPTNGDAALAARNVYASLDAPSALLDVVTGGDDDIDGRSGGRRGGGGGGGGGDDGDDNEGDDDGDDDGDAASHESDEHDNYSNDETFPTTAPARKASNFSDGDGGYNEQHYEPNNPTNEMETMPVQAVPSFEELIADSELVELSDRTMWPDHVLAAFAQLVPCRVTEHDRKGVYRNLQVGFIGLCCKWCGGMPSRGRCFPNQMRNYGRVDTHAAIVKHFEKDCTFCPPLICKAIQKLQKRRNEQYGSRMEFAEILWNRVQSVQPDENADLLLHPENKGTEYSPADKMVALASVGIQEKRKVKPKNSSNMNNISSGFKEYDPSDFISPLATDHGDDESRRSGRKRKAVEYAPPKPEPVKKPREYHPLQIFTRPTLKCNMDYYVEEYGHWNHNPPFPFKVTKPSRRLQQTEEGYGNGDHAIMFHSIKQEKSVEAQIIPTVIPEIPELTPEQKAAQAGFDEREIVTHINQVEDPSLVESYGVAPENLPKIPGPAPMPPLPSTGKCLWTFDSRTRVLRADFTSQGKEPIFSMHPTDSKFFFQMMEKDDITLVSHGMLNYHKLTPQLWDIEYMGDRLKGDFYHKFRRFDRIFDQAGNESFKEVDKMYSMRVEDYVRYMTRRSEYLEDVKRAPPDEPVVEPQFTFLDAEDKEHTICVGTTALYMIDVDMKRLMPWMYDNFQESFNLPAVLPGGSHCMMNPVTPDARPFMGPNLYITPPASFTHFHQDGHGTVDSGHLVISGYNEVVILRRLPERHKKHALWILTGKKSDKTWWDGLYSEPHGDGLGEKPAWPTVEMISECENMGYCPAVCILEPGDMIHINKGRLHAFRKMSTKLLPPTDCHAQLRSDVIVKNGLSGEHRCVSVAWDWMYRGVTSAGINREVCAVLEATILNQKNGVVSLAIPEISLLHMAKQAVAPLPSKPFGVGSFLLDLPHCREISNSLSSKSENFLYDASPQDFCRGILPGLRHVVHGHISSLSSATNNKRNSRTRGERLRVAEKPDSKPNPALHPVDPLGNADFACRLCRKELSNVYYHCDGCENLLSKDYNICKDCHVDKRFMIFEQMHPTNPKRHATLNHTGNFHYDRESRCPCKNGPVCNDCSYCLGCSCRCHTWFTLKTRLISKDDEKSLLQKVEQVAGAPLSAMNSQPASNWTLSVKRSPAEFDVETMTTLANERFADAKYGPRSVNTRIIGK